MTDAHLLMVTITDKKRQNGIPNAGWTILSDIFKVFKKLNSKK